MMIDDDDDDDDDDDMLMMTILADAHRSWRAAAIGNILPRAWKCSI